MRVNSDHKVYEFAVPGLFKIFYRSGDNAGIRLKIFFYSFAPKFKNKKRNFKTVDKDLKSRSKKSKKRRKRNIRMEHLISLVKRFFKSFKVNRFEANIDTGDYALNSHLIPLVILTGTHNKININYHNINHIHLEIRGNVYKLLWLGMWFLIKTK